MGPIKLLVQKIVLDPKFLSKRRSGPKNMSKNLGQKKFWSGNRLQKYAINDINILVDKYVIAGIIIVKLQT